MKRLLLTLLFLSGAAVAQIGNVVDVFSFGAPTGSCPNNFTQDIDVTNSVHYDCINGSWVKIGPSSGSSGLSGMTAGQVPIAATATTVTSSKAIQGTDTNLLSAGTVSGSGASLCTDTNGGATTIGCPGSASPIFSTAVTGTSMATSGTNTVLVGPVSMVTPAANGTYRFVIQIIATAGGSGGTCNLGAILVSLSYKEADTGNTYALSASGNVWFLTRSTTGLLSTITFTTAVNAAGSAYSVPIELHAASGTAIQYQVVQTTNSNCTTPPVFAVRPALYSLGY